MGERLVRLEADEVLEGCVTARVVVDPSRMRTVDVPGLASRVLCGLPLLVGHACDNAAGRSMRDELGDTEVAHVVEHVAVELLARAAPMRGTRGETSWDFARDGEGVFRVCVHHPDVGCAAEALDQACRLVEDWSVERQGDTAAAISAVREARTVDRSGD